MATFNVNAKVSNGGLCLGSDADPSTTVNAADTANALIVTDAVAVAAAIAVLVADAGSPTQGHVNTLNAAYATLAADITAAKAATALAKAQVVTGASDVSLTVNTSNCQKHSTYIAARQLLEAALIQKIGAFPTAG